jgi:hypothetical protein
MQMQEDFKLKWLRLAGHVIRREHRAARNPKAEV